MVLSLFMRNNRVAAASKGKGTWMLTIVVLHEVEYKSIFITLPENNLIETNAFSPIGFAITKTD